MHMHDEPKKLAADLVLATGGLLLAARDTLPASTIFTKLFSFLKSTLMAPPLRPATRRIGR